jgi:hypothetical protein
MVGFGLQIGGLVGLPVGLIVDFGSQIGGLVGLCCGCWVYIM